MASEQIVDIDQLTQAIAGDAPQGTDPRGDRSASSLYAIIKDARNSARAAERANLFDQDAGADIAALWRPVLQQSPKLLTEQAKDLEIACWYLEALVRKEGFAGLRDGFALIDALVEKFWDGLFPEPDEDGLETRVAPLTGLNGDSGEGTLPTPLRNVPITAPGSGSGNFDSYSFWQFQQAQETDKLTDTASREERATRLGFTLADVRNAVQASPDAFYVDLLADLDTILDTYKRLHNRLRQHCGGDAPPSSTIQTLLEEIQRGVRFLTKDKLAHLQQAEATADEDTGTAAAPRTGGAGPGISAGPIASREEALQRLTEVARFFRATEPHTPIASGIERLVRWGRMSVAELMVELVPDSTARAIYTQLTGVAIGERSGSSPAVVVAPTSSSSSSNSSSSSDGWSSPSQSDSKW
jgi:type VI secretion system protein ImpA